MKNPFNINLSDLSNTDMIKTDHMHNYKESLEDNPSKIQMRHTPSDLFGALTRIKSELLEVCDQSDETLKTHVKNLYEVCDLLQDLIEAKNKAK